jgi:hypothetical protein
MLDEINGLAELRRRWQLWQRRKLSLRCLSMCCDASALTAHLVGQQRQRAWQMTAGKALPVAGVVARRRRRRVNRRDPKGHRDRTART